MNTRGAEESIVFLWFTYVSIQSMNENVTYIGYQLAIAQLFSFIDYRTCIEHNNRTLTEDCLLIVCLMNISVLL